MKLLNLKSSYTTYIIGFWCNKLSGYFFFTLKQTAEGIKFQRTWMDSFFFAISFVFSFYLAVVGGNELAVKIRSEILLMGAKFALKISLITSLFSKLANFIGAKKGFEIIQHFRTIDKEVC
jgi:hypothetical protein